MATKVKSQVQPKYKGLVKQVRRVLNKFVQSFKLNDIRVIKLGAGIPLTQEIIEEIHSEIEQIKLINETHQILITKENLETFLKYNCLTDETLYQLIEVCTVIDNARLEFLGKLRNKNIMGMHITSPSNLLIPTITRDEISEDGSLIIRINICFALFITKKDIEIIEEATALAAIRAQKTAEMTQANQELLQ